MAVGYWESRILVKMVYHWKMLPAQIADKADACSRLHKAYTKRRFWEMMRAGYVNRKLESGQLRTALTYFGTNLTKAAFDGWRTVLLQAKTWFLRGEQSHLEHAWRQLRKGCSGMARVGHRLMTAAGLDLEKRRRASYNRLVAHAQHMIGLQVHHLPVSPPPHLPPWLTWADLHCVPFRCAGGDGILA